MTNYLFTLALSELVPSLFSRRSRALSSAAFFIFQVLRCQSSWLMPDVIHTSNHVCRAHLAKSYHTYKLFLWSQSPVSNYRARKLEDLLPPPIEENASVFIIATFSLFAKEVNTNDFHICICDRLFLSWIKLDRLVRRPVRYSVHRFVIANISSSLFPSHVTWPLTPWMCSLCDKVPRIIRIKSDS